MSVREVGPIPRFAGQIVWPDDPDYDRARTIWNAMHDRRPALIARCTSPQDVTAAIRHARNHRLTIAVRGGGHRIPGHSVCDHGIVIDLRGIRSVRVDPGARRARVGGGALLGELDQGTQRYGLVVPSGTVSHTGVGGLTLGGGLGRLMRRFGLTIDSLISAEVVTADGHILRANETENSDLFWGLRGGGGNFGVVTEFEFALHELRSVLILGMFNGLADARKVLERGRDVMRADPPDALLWTSFLRKAPPLPWVPEKLQGQLGVMSLVEWSGNPADGQELLRGLRQELAPAASSLDVVPFLAIQTQTDEIFAAGKRTYIKEGFVYDLTEGVIETVCTHGARVGSPFSQIEVISMGGAIRRVPPEETAFPHRDAGWMLNIPTIWESAADDETEIAWARGAFTALEPHMTGGEYVNFMGDDEAAAPARAYGRTLDRLREIKRRYDPENVFRLNQNIAP